MLSASAQNQREHQPMKLGNGGFHGELCFCDGQSFIQARVLHVPFGYKLLIISFIRVSPQPPGSFISSRTFSRFFVRKLLIINDACPNNATAG
jgi:hypothetical protein